MKKSFTCRALIVCLIISVLFIANPSPLHARQDAATPTYTMQLVTIQDKATADAALEKIRKRGHDAYIVEYTTEAGRVLYKIRTGKFTSRADAVAAADRYTVQEGESVLVVTQVAPVGEPSGPEAQPALQDKAEAIPGKTARVTAQPSAAAAKPDSLQEKINALRRGEWPPAKKPQTRQKTKNDSWFTIQTGTVFDKRLADRRITRLRDRGYEAYCVEVIQNKKRFYKIRFGRFVSAREAGRAARSYNERERRICMVKKIVAGVDVTPNPARGAVSKKQSRVPDTAAPVQYQGTSKVLPAEPKGTGLQDAAELPAHSEQPQPGKAVQAQLPEAVRPAERNTPAAKQADAKKKPMAASSKSADAQQARARPEKPPAVETPEKMTSIYAYRQKSGALNLTNRYEDIPAALRKNIDYISLFPTRIKNITKSGLRLTLECRKGRKEIFLAGLTIPGRGDAALAYLKALENTPLRLKYNPWMDTKNGAIAGGLYLKEGRYINLDMVRKGLGKYNRKTLAPDQQGAFRKAQDAARHEGIGIWGKATGTSG